MCQAMSLLVTQSKKVYWKTGVDSHDELHTLFVKKDKELIDDKKPPNNTFARVEIHPKNKDYLRPDKWVYFIDERVKPKWLNKSYEKLCWSAFKKWKKQVYSQFNLKEVLNPIHPFKIKAPKKITKRHIEAVRLWALVGPLTRVSVRDSVWASAWDSAWDSVWASIGDSVGDSAGDSVRAYIGSLFKIKKWEYVDYRKKPFNKLKGKYPFYPAVYLWKRGLVPVHYNSKWYLCGSPKGDGKGEVLWKEEK